MKSSLQNIRCGKIIRYIYIKSISLIGKRGAEDEKKGPPNKKVKQEGKHKYFLVNTSYESCKSKKSCPIS